MVNESLTTDEKLPGGAEFAHRMYNRSFTSLDGHALFVNSNGDHDGLYAIIAMDSKKGHLEVIFSV